MRHSFGIVLLLSLLALVGGAQAQSPRESFPPTPRLAANCAEQAVDWLARGGAGERVRNRVPPLKAPSGQLGFPPLPPDPFSHQRPPLPDMASELWRHGGSYLYQPEGDRLNWPPPGTAHYERLRLPEDWRKPEPATLFSEFLGADPITLNDRLRWGPGGYVWRPEFVGYGGYEMFSFAHEQNNQRLTGTGHQLLLEADLRLTGTERFHMQMRPLGDGASGGSYYQYNKPNDGYVDNSTGEPQRYWFEGELHSMLGAYVDPFSPLDVNFAVGKFPFALQNSLLMNDEIQGVVVSKNTMQPGPLSNLNVQLFYGFNDVDTFVDAEAQLYGVHLQADRDRVFYELTYAFVDHEFDATRDSHFAAVSRTGMFGPFVWSARGLFKWGDRGGAGAGQLYVLEGNYTRVFDRSRFGIESASLFCNAFAATSGWNSIGGGNFNRLRTAFEVNPLIRRSAGFQNRDTMGVALGAQLFRLHRDESWVPEVAYEAPGGEPVLGLGLRYLRKTGPRTYLNVLGTVNFSDDPQFRRDGVFSSFTILF